MPIAAMPLPITMPLFSPGHYFSFIFDIDYFDASCR
jgi:hypothetical protein